MLSGRQILSLVKTPKIRPIDEHVGLLYAMRSEEMSGTLGALVGGYLGVVGSAVLLMLAPVQEGADPAELHRRLFAAGILFATAGVFSTVVMKRMISDLRDRVGWTKDLALRLREYYA